MSAHGEEHAPLEIAEIGDPLREERVASADSAFALTRTAF